MAKGAGKKFIIGLIIVLGFAYGMAMTGVSIYFVRQVDELNLEALSLELARDGAKKRTEQIDIEVQALKEQEAKLQKMLNSLNEESQKKIDQLSQEAKKGEENKKALEKKVSSSKKTLNKAQEGNKKLKKLLAEATALSSKEKNKENDGLKELIEKKDEEIKFQKEKAEKLQKELKEKESQVHYNLGVNFFDRQDFENAIIEYEKAVEANPSHGPSYYNLGMLYEEYEKDYPGAARYYRQYLEFTPDAKDTVLVEGWISELELKTEETTY